MSIKSFHNDLYSETFNDILWTASTWATGKHPSGESCWKGWEKSEMWPPLCPPAGGPSVRGDRGWAPVHWMSSWNDFHSLHQDKFPNCDFSWILRKKQSSLKKIFRTVSDCRGRKHSKWNNHQFKDWVCASSTLNSFNSALDCFVEICDKLLSTIHQPKQFSQIKFAILR